jgi:hypothetical protein
VGNGPTQSTPSLEDVERSLARVVAELCLKAEELGKRLKVSSSIEERRSIVKEFGEEGPDLLHALLKTEGTIHRVACHAVELLRGNEDRHYSKAIAEAEEALGVLRTPSEVRKELGKNFLGAEEWRVQGIEVGEAPPIPTSITKALLNSECPLHPGEKIKDTHLLVLIPKTVNGEPYSGVKLSELCASRKGSGDRLIYDATSWARAWQQQSWAQAPQSRSEWIFIPKGDPDPWHVPFEKHFRSKSMSQQQSVYYIHYQEYGEVKSVGLITAVVLNDLVNGAPRMLEGSCQLRCHERDLQANGRTQVGQFGVDGLRIHALGRDVADREFGLALARRL